MQPANLLVRIRRGDVNNVAFADLVRLEALGFRAAGGRGSHRVFGHPETAVEAWMDAAQATGTPVPQPRPRAADA